jgi:hypothetical protein
MAYYPADTAGFHCVELAGVYCTDWRDWPVWLAFLAGLQKIWLQQDDPRKDISI